MSQLYSDSIFWIETEKVSANPYQPRKDFNESALQDLADSIRQYGVLQPLVVTRHEVQKEDGGIAVEYELIAGERRLRASRLAQLKQIPVIIRSGEDAKMKLELAIIENLQREDLNPIDRARAFLRLADEFELTHGQIGKKMGKSREYVSNSMRLLQLPQEIMEGLQQRRISEGHARTLMMLKDRPDEQSTLFKEIVYKKMSVRESEQVARSIAKDKVRKKDPNRNPEFDSYQEKLAEKLGTRVHIEAKEVGGKIVIDFFSPDDIDSILKMLSQRGDDVSQNMLEKFISSQKTESDNQTVKNVSEKSASDSETSEVRKESDKISTDEHLEESQKNTSDSADVQQETSSNSTTQLDEAPEEGNAVRAEYTEKLRALFSTYHNNEQPAMEDELYLEEDENEEEDADLYNVNDFSV